MAERTLFIVTTSDSENISLEFIAEGVAGNLDSLESAKKFLCICRPFGNNIETTMAIPSISNTAPKRRQHQDQMDVFHPPLLWYSRVVVPYFSSHSLLHERSQLAVIINFDQLLRPIGRVGNVELHLDQSSLAVKMARRERKKGARWSMWSVA